MLIIGEAHEPIKHGEHHSFMTMTFAQRSEMVFDCTSWIVVSHLCLSPARSCWIKIILRLHIILGQSKEVQWERSHRKVYLKDWERRTTRCMAKCVGCVGRPSDRSDAADYWRVVDSW